MEDQKFSFSGSFRKAKEYIDTQVSLLQLKAIAKGSRIIGNVVVDASKILLGLMVVFFFSLALGFYLGELMGSYALGFFTTGCFFVLLIVIIRVLEPKLEKWFINMTIRKVLAKWNEDDEQLSAMCQVKEEITEEEDTITDKEKTDER